MGVADTEPETWQTSACILRECNCGIEVQLEGRRLTRPRTLRDRLRSAAQ